MAYRTYRHLYRVRPSISSIGQGRHRIRLPRGMQITLDWFVLTLVFLIPASLIAAPIMQNFADLPKWLWGIGISAFLSYKLSKLDPGGKTVTGYIKDLVVYIIRNKVHDGFQKQNKLDGKKKVQFETVFYLAEGDKVASFPASGKVSKFTLRVPAAVRVNKKGIVSFHPKGKRLAPGCYEITEDLRIVERQAPPAFGKRGIKPSLTK